MFIVWPTNIECSLLKVQKTYIRQSKQYCLVTQVYFFPPDSLYWNFFLNRKIQRSKFGRRFCFVHLFCPTMSQKLEKKFQFQMCIWVVARLPQRLKSTFFEIFGDRPLEIFSKNIDFCHCGKQCIVLPKWNFFRVLAHCVILNVKEGGGRQCTSLYSTYLVVFDKFVFMAGGRFYGQVVFIFFCIDAPFRFTTTTVGLLEEHQRVENQDGYIFYWHIRNCFNFCMVNSFASSCHTASVS